MVNPESNKHRKKKRRHNMDQFLTLVGEMNLAFGEARVFYLGTSNVHKARVHGNEAIYHDKRMTTNVLITTRNDIISLMRRIEDGHCKHCRVCYQYYHILKGIIGTTISRKAIISLADSWLKPGKIFASFFSPECWLAFVFGNNEYCK